MEKDGVGSGGHCPMNLVEEDEGGPRQNYDRCCAQCGGGILSVPAGQGVSDRVEAPRPVLHVEVEAEKLADPLVLGHRREALVQQVLQAKVVGADDEVAAPQVWLPMPDCLDHTYELALICRELKVTGSEWPAEECQGPCTLVKDRAEPRP
jgi:hypothetical protein